MEAGKTDAINHHLRDLKVAKEVMDRAGEGRAYCNLGNAYQGLGDFKQAVEYHMLHCHCQRSRG